MNQAVSQSPDRKHVEHALRCGAGRVQAARDTASFDLEVKRLHGVLDKYLQNAPKVVK